MVEQYYDMDGEPVTLHQLISLEPGWAHSRIKRCEELETALAEREWVSVSLGDMYASDCWCGERAMLGISRVRGPEGCVDAVTNGRTFCERHWQPLPKPPTTPENEDA